MKKGILLIICFVTSIFLYGQKHEFEYITDDLFFHKPDIFESSPYDRFYTSKDGSSRAHYEGWIDSTGTPRCFGKLVEGVNNIVVSGQLKDGKFDGWCSSREIGFDGIMKWQDSSRTVVPVGWGRSSIPFTYVSDPSKGGLAISDGQNYYLVEQGSEISRLNALDTYKKLLYDDNKQHIKKVCAQKGLKYVEDVRLGIFSYSGGWKDGQPYLYGAYKDHPDSYHKNKVVFCGYFNYTPKDYTFTADNKGSWTEYHHVMYNPFVLHQHTISLDSATSQQLIIDVDINFGHYSKTISDTKGNVLEFEAFYFNDGQYLFGKRENPKDYFWGCIVGRYDFYEGYIGSSGGSLLSMESTGSYGKVIHANGHMIDNTIGNNKKIVKFSNGDVIWIDKLYEKNNGLFLGDYTYADGSYIVGIFAFPKNNWNREGYIPIYADSYDKNNVIKKSYVETGSLRGIQVADIENEIARLKKEHNIPLNGYGTIVGDDYTYTGEFHAKMYHGKGKITYRDGTYKDGVWKKGAFVSGTAHIKNTDGEYIGEMKGTAPYGTGKFTYNNGSYKDGTFEKGGLKSGEIYMIYDDGTSFKGIYKLFHAKEGTFTTSDGTKVIRTWIVSAERSIIRDYVDIIYPNGSEYHGPCYKTIIKDGNKREYSLEGDHVTIVDTIGNRYMGGWGPTGRVGNGIDAFANGDSISTSWQDNVYAHDAEFTYVWSDGRKFVGVAGKKGKTGKGVYYNSDGSEASKKEYKNWVMLTPITMDIHVNPVKRNFP